jgi:hypothetical protein
MEGEKDGRGKSRSGTRLSTHTLTPEDAIRGFLQVDAKKVRAAEARERKAKKARPPRPKK